MKHILIIATTIFISFSAFSQKAATNTTDETPVYLRFPTIPEFTVYKAPDSTAFTRNDLHKKKNTIFVIFSPDCEHCQRETEMLTQNINKFKNTQFVMVTYLPWEEMIAFYHHYKISNYPQITMARDTKFFFPVFFKVRNLPSIFVYDKKGNLKKSFEGDVKPETILAEL
ncbi:MAG TPA: redoxin domain-containing protein [Hanamia sp.]|nr:redoxin domain-containing protein [Hanamia sp.]